MDIILKAYLIIICVTLVYAVYMIIKNEFVYRNRMKIINAIYAYNMDHISANDYISCISCDVMETYNETERRFWDWGYEHIVPENIYERIKEYI